MKDLTPHKSYIKMIRRPEFCKFVHGEDIWPWQIEISPTDNCALKCPWCVSGELTHAERSQRRTLDADVLIRFLQQFVEKEGKAITLTGGGEPTQHPEIARIIHEAADMGLQIGLFTNGVYHKDLNEALARCLWVRFSVDFGESGWHKKYPSKATFEQMCDNIEYLSVKDLTVGLNVNVGPQHTQIDIDELIGMAEIADYLQFRVLLPTKYTEDFSLAPIWEYINLLRGKGLLPAPRFRFSDDRLTELDANKFYAWDICRGHHFVPFLHADGNLQACAYHPNNHKTYFGNIYMKSWRAIWIGQQRQDAIKYVSEMDYKAMCQPCCKLTAWNELLDPACKEQLHEYFT